MTITEKSRENRARRIAERRGFRLEKSRRRDPHATDFGRYQLVDTATGTIASIGGGWLTLAEVERQLEILSVVGDPETVRLVQAVVGLAKVLTPFGLDPRTMGRLAEPVTAAARLLGDGTTEDLAAAASKILAAGPPAPPDFMTVQPLLDELTAAFRAYELSRGRLPRPLVDAPRFTRFD